MNEARSKGFVVGAVICCCCVGGGGDRLLGWPNRPRSLGRCKLAQISIVFASQLGIQVVLLALKPEEKARHLLYEVWAVALVKQQDSLAQLRSSFKLLQERLVFVTFVSTISVQCFLKALDHLHQGPQAVSPII